MGGDWCFGGGWVKFIRFGFYFIGMRKLMLVICLVFLVGCASERSWEITSSDELKGLYPGYLEIGGGWEIGEVKGVGSLEKGFLLGAMQEYEQEQKEIRVYASLFGSSESAKVVCEKKFKWEGEEMKGLPKGCVGSLNELEGLEVTSLGDMDLARICCVRDLVVIDIKAKGNKIGEEAKRVLELILV